MRPFKMKPPIPRARNFCTDHFQIYFEGYFAGLAVLKIQYVCYPSSRVIKNKLTSKENLVPDRGTSITKDHFIYTTGHILQFLLVTHKTWFTFPADYLLCKLSLMT